VLGGSGGLVQSCTSRKRARMFPRSASSSYNSMNISGLSVNVALAYLTNIFSLILAPFTALMGSRENGQGLRFVSLQCLSLESADLTVSRLGTCYHFAAIIRFIIQYQSRKGCNPYVAETLEI
jgi:hypothetical protein